MQKPFARWKQHIFSNAGEVAMYINIYAIIAGLFGTLFILTKMRHPHIKHVREGLEGTILFKAINALDFYTGNHALFYDELFPELSSNHTQSKDPFQSPVSSNRSCIIQSPDVDSYFPTEKSQGAGAYHILLALCATAGVSIFSVAVYLRKTLRLALRQRNVVIHASQVERRVSHEANSAISASNEKGSQDAQLLPSSSVSVVTRRDDSIFYTNTEPVVVAPPIPVALSESSIRMNSQPSVPYIESRAIQNDSVTPLIADSLPPPPPLIVPSATETITAQPDDDLPNPIPLSQDEPQPVAAEEPPCLNVGEPSSEVEADVAAISYLSYLPFAQGLDAQGSAPPTPAPISSPDSGTPSPRNAARIVAPAARRVYTPQVSCRRPDWLTSAQYREAHSKLNALVSNTAPGIETTADPMRLEAPVISPADGLDSPSHKISVPRVCASTSLAQPTTVTGSASHWDHLVTSVGAPTERPFVAGRTGADLVLAMSTSMPRVIDLGLRSAGGGQYGEREGASGNISPLAEISISPRASSILRQVAAATADTAQTSHAVSSRRRRSVMTTAVLQNPWLNRGGSQESAPATATRSTGVSPVQTAVQRSVIRRVLGPQRNGSADRPSERWITPADNVERPPLRVTRIFGEPPA
ncbi:hypothetical protein C0992_004088 [Termitomyces sp. T32_za158]|nr:hypothetical protein C0992_004088 [Termitomyces sp. T32_za158]